jgi:hypothetical protein
MQNRSIKGTTDWKRYDVVLDVAEEAAEVAFGILLSQTGAVWISAVSVEVTDRGVATTNFTAERPNKAPRNVDLNEPAPASAGPPPGWGRLGDREDDYAVGVDHQILFQGNPTAYIKSKIDQIDGFETLRQTVDSRPYKKRWVRLSAHLQTTNVTGWAGLFVSVDGKGDSAVSDYMEHRPITGSTPWRPYDVLLPVAPEANAIAFGVLLVGSGAVSMGGITLEAVDESVAAKSRQAGPQNLELAR